MPYFVWVRSMKKPEAQIWWDLLKDMQGQIKPHIYLREISEVQARVGLDALKDFFPAPLYIPE